MKSGGTKAVGECSWWELAQIYSEKPNWEICEGWAGADQMIDDREEPNLFAMSFFSRKFN